MANFKTIHIFGYGETQIIKEKESKKVSSTGLTKISALVSDIFSKKPQDNDCINEYHAINIFEGMFCDFIPKDGTKKSFRVKYSDIKVSLINALVTEVDAVVVA